MNKKLLIISVSIVGILALALGVYFAWRNSKDIIPPISAPVSNVASSTALANEVVNNKLAAIAQNKVFDYWIFEANPTSSDPVKNIFYASLDGGIYKIAGNKEELVNNLQSGDIQSVNASYDGKMVLIKSDFFGKSRFDILNAETNIWQLALFDISAADWSPEGRELAYLQDNGKGGFDLIIKDFGDSKKKLQKIISLNQSDFDLKWRQSQKILLIPKPSIDYFSEIWEIDLKTKAVSKIASGRSLMIDWLKFGDLGLKFSSTGGRNYEFSLIGDKNSGNGVFKFKTFPDKCLLNSPIRIYCAIPRDQSVFSNFSFPDDYFKKKVYFNDGIYAINLEDSGFTPLLENADPIIDAINLKMFGDKLLFINRYDQKLYRLDL